ncbi:GntR family transcriptional regulator [Polynucleobacter sp. VK25]|nr:GntR family transcriptional regulator [Polynucleobacter sp. VK25]
MDFLKLTQRSPLYKSLAKTLEQRIYNGDWPVGSVLPAEADLCRDFQSSRHTLRHALQILEANGLIYRHQGAPTKVVSRRRLRRFTQSYNSPIDILSYSRDTYRQNMVEEFIELDKPLSQIVGAPVGSSWYHIGGIRKRQQAEEVIAWTDIYILPQFASLTKDPEHTQVMVYEQIEEKYGARIERAEVDVFASQVSIEIAEKLRIKPEAPCLVIIRRYFDDQDKLFEVTVTHHPENKYVYSMEFKASSEV